MRKTRKLNNPDASKNAFAALYIRVSTEAQAEEGYSIDAQKERLTAYCKVKKIERYEYYIDGAFSGSNIERPQLKRLIDEVKAGKITHVMVYKLDRLSRSQKDTLYLIEDVFNPHGTDFVSMEENFDTSTPIGRAMLGIISAFAQLERETIFERTRMGMLERVKQGLWMGGGKIPFGYDYDKNTGTLIKNSDSKTVEQIYNLYIKGYSPQKIADILGLKYEQWVTDILKRKLNAGYIYYNGVEYKGKHEAIVSEELYNKAMEIMELRSKNRLYKPHHLLTGLVYCGVCGAKMRYQKWGKSGFRLVCYSQQKSKKYLVKDENCNNERPWAYEVEDELLKNLFSLKMFTDDEEIEQDGSAAPIEILNSQRIVTEAKIKRLYNLFSTDENPILLETIEENKQILQNIVKQIEDEKEKSFESRKIIDAKIRCLGLKEAWERLTFEERRTAIESLVEKIVVNGNAIDIHYKFITG